MFKYDFVMLFYGFCTFRSIFQCFDKIFTKTLALFANDYKYLKFTIIFNLRRLDEHNVKIISIFQYLSLQFYERCSLSDFL